MNLQANYGGIQLKNPFLAASSGCTMNADRCKRAEDAGFAAVVLKSVQEETVMRYNPNPRFALLHDGVPGFSSDSFYCYEQAYEYDIDAYCGEIARCKQALDIPVVASVNCITLEKWGEYARACEQAGADALELVPCCPSGFLMTAAKDIEAYSLAALQECVKTVKSIPVGVKVTMQLSNPLKTALALQEAGADDLILFNRLTGCDIDIDAKRPILHGGFAGHGGPWVKHVNMRWMIAAAPHLRIPVSAVGGVTGWEDAVKYMMCGAQSVQVCSLTYLQGYGSIIKLIDGLRAYLEREELSGLHEIVGAAVPNLVENAQADRSHRFYAEVNEEQCKNCGRCREVCLYGALEYGGRGPRISRERCDGCNLCAAVCPQKAVSMIQK